MRWKRWLSCASQRSPTSTGSAQEIADAKGPASPFAVWRLAQDDDNTAEERLINLLSSDDATNRTRAAYVLGRLLPLSAATNDAIISAFKKEPPDTTAHAMLRAALGHDEVRKLATDATVAPTGRYFASMRLSQCGSPADSDILTPLLTDSDSDVRVAAVYALLTINARAATTIPTTPLKSASFVQYTIHDCPCFKPGRPGSSRYTPFPADSVGSALTSIGGENDEILFSA